LKARREKSTTPCVIYLRKFLFHDLTRIDTVFCIFKLRANSFYDTLPTVTDKKGIATAFDRDFHATTFPVGSLSTRIDQAIQLNFPIGV